MLNSLEMVIAVPIFVILTICCQKGIRSGMKMETGPSWVLAACVAAVSIIAMFNHGETKAVEEKKVVNVILLPYAVMGIAMLLSLLLAFWFKCRHKFKKFFSDQINKERFKFDERMRK